jgi:hypothetical protein
MPLRGFSRSSSSQQEVVAVLADGAQLVELGVEAVGDDAAFAQQHAGCSSDRGASSSCR